MMYFQVFSDDNDVEGFIFESQDRTNYSFRANGYLGDPKIRLAGRPIGFRVWQGMGGIDNQILKIAIVYNECNCPSSEFMADSPVADMSTVFGGKD